ncbi:MAG: 50S ribosomal protein L11 methyltransferase [Bacteroidetes bacterium]|nr:MAG: 50S ribosomal protein L11 methyltransferase [Bacteroidota bacterium]
MDYLKYNIRVSADLSEILMAFLAEAPFDTFEETEEGLNAYLPAGAGPQATTETEQLLDQLREQYPFEWSKTLLPAQNWNEIWESNFEPVVVEDFCAVRADFHPPVPGVQYELVINPKMAFGTGHHETTWMCLRALRDLPCQQARLLDFGCGTGVLAIMAARLGAAHIEAVDIEEESFRNTLENAEINGVSDQITARCGTLDSVQGTAFDGILANINRNVILDTLPRLSELVRPGGWLLVSGILEQDGTLVQEQAAAAGFNLQHSAQRGNWLCLRFHR